MSTNVCFIGLGNMGHPMAESLLKNRVNLFVYNRTKSKADDLLKQGASWLNSPSEAFKHATIVFTMVANDQALIALTEGPNGILANAKPGCIHVSMSTISPKLSRELTAKHQEKGVHYLASPVFGRPDVAAQQNLWICISGNSSAKKQVDPLLHFIGKKVYDFGEEPASANVVKLAGNFLILNTVEMLSEAFTFVEKSGVDPQKVHEFITDSLFPTPVHKTYGQLILSQNFDPAGFKMKLGLKDIDLLLRAAEEVRVPLPSAGLLHDRLLAGLAHNRGEMDWSAIALTELEEAGITRRT